MGHNDPMSSGPTEWLLHAGSRVKRAVHRASAPRTPPATRSRTEQEVDALVGLLFPDGVDGESVQVVRAVLQTQDLDASTVRRLLGQVDQQRSPSPFSVRLSAADVVMVPHDGVQVALDRADRSVSSAIIESGTWEPHVERVLSELLAEGSVFVDIGANVGWHSALAATLVGDAGLVYAVEPNPENAKLIAETIRHNKLTNMRLLPFALSEQAGYALFRSAIGSNGGFADRDRSEIIDPRVTIVPTVRFDDLEIEHVDVIKIDVEGAEPMVMRGATKAIERDHPSIIFEFSCEMTERVGGVSPQAHLEMIESFGYRLSVIERGTGELLPIGSIDELLSGWGDHLRIEDFVAIAE